MSPTQLELIGTASGLNNSHTYPIAHTVDITHISSIPVLL